MPTYYERLTNVFMLQRVKESLHVPARQTPLFPFGVYSLSHNLQPRALFRAVLPKRLGQYLTGLCLHRVDSTDWFPAIAVYWLQTMSSTNLNQLVAYLQLVGDVDGIERLVPAEGPEDPGSGM